MAVAEASGSLTAAPAVDAAPARPEPAAPVEASTEHAQRFYGVIKSYNERRGFGFLACEETARQFGRDSYLSKEEAAILAKVPIVGAQSREESTIPPVKEGDFVQFEVHLSSEGYPQAVRARRLRRLWGVVNAAAGREPGSNDGCIVVRGDGANPEADTRTDAHLAQLIGAEVRLRQSDCGQLWLAPGDEVVFCCAAAAKEGDDASEPDVLEAQLIELMSTPRSAGLMLGCFTLELPRTPEPVPADKAAEAGEKVPLPPPKPTGTVTLDGYALTDRVVLAGLPTDLAVPELMRLFTKLGATDAVATHQDAGSSTNGGYASIAFTGPLDVARMLARAAHTINEQGLTQLARLKPARRGAAAASLPALPAPCVERAEGGALLIQWTPVGLAAGYQVELRPVGHGDAAWSAVAVATEALEDSPRDLPPGLLGPQCTACRVNNLQTGLPYEARVTYYAPNACRSQASASSAPCTAASLSPAEPSLSEATPVPTSSPSPPTTPPAAPPPPPPPASAPPVASPVELLEPLSEVGAMGVPMGMPWLPQSQDLAGQYMLDPAGMAQPPAVYSHIPMPQPPLQHPPHMAQPPLAPMQLSAGMPSLSPPMLGVAAGWRCLHGAIIPPPAAPELLPFDEAGRSLSIQWPMVVHAGAYTVELLEEGATTAERFTRSVVESHPEALVELRVGNLKPGAYAACVRCVAHCGCESSPSSWSFIPPAWMTAPPIHPGFGWPPPSVSPLAVPAAPVSGAESTLNPHAPPHSPGSTPGPAAVQAAYLSAPPPLLSTNPNPKSSAATAGTMPPPPPAAPPMHPASGGASGAQPVMPPGGEEALVLD